MFCVDYHVDDDDDDDVCTVVTRSERTQSHVRSLKQEMCSCCFCKITTTTVKIAAD